MKTAKDLDATCPFTGLPCKRDTCIAYIDKEGGLCVLVKR